MVRLVLDTDPGVDDAHALMMALAHPSAQVLSGHRMSGLTEIALQPSPTPLLAVVVRCESGNRPYRFPRRGFSAPAFAPLALDLQEVVHSNGSREADCDEQSSFRGQTEWTSTRMPDSLCAVERL